MAALTNARDTSEIANGAKALVLPVKGSTTIYQGAFVRRRDVLRRLSKTKARTEMS